MENKVINYIKQNELIEPGANVLVGVSGGPDSMALLYFLYRQQTRLQMNIMAISFDHQLRGAVSMDDVAYVQRVCKQLHIPFLTQSLSVSAYQSKHRLGTQQAARELRYQAFSEAMRDNQMDHLALGHHADDQIETVFMALTRTTTLHPLTGIPVKRPFSTGSIVRPFLCLTKEAIENYCKRHQLNPRVDASNFENNYTRNRMRHNIIPQLKKENPNLAQTIQQLTHTLHEDDIFLNKEAKNAFERISRVDEKTGTICFVNSELCIYPVSLQRRIFRLTLGYLYDVLPEIGHKHETAFLSLIRGQGNKVLHFPDALKIEKSYDNIKFSFRGAAQTDASFRATVGELPASIQLPDGGRLSIHMKKQMPQNGTTNKNIFICPKNNLFFPLIIRTRKPGDRMEYEGLHGTKKIKDIFIDEKIPREKRSTWCLVTDRNDQILWLINLKKSMQHIQENTDEYVLFEYQYN